MTENIAENLESRIDNLLNDGLDPQEQRKLLSLIAHDDHARMILKEAIDLQSMARAAYGYDQADAALAASLQRTRELLAGKHVAPGHGLATAKKRRRFPSLLFRASTLVRIAATVIVVVSIYVAVVAYQTKQQIRGAIPKMPGVTEDELAYMRTIWNEVFHRADKSRPWIVLSENGGKFGYVPADQADLLTEKGDQPTIVRCLLFSPDDKSVIKLSLLIPSQREIRLSIPEVGQVAGHPIHCDVWLRDKLAGVGLAAGDGKGEATGVKGRVRIGQEPVEVGQFLLDGKQMKVVLQALPLDVASI